MDELNAFANRHGSNGHGWPALVRSYGVSDPTATRLIRSLVASEAAALAFCRLLDRWAKGEPEPCTPGRRQAALRRAAERAETALAGLERPLGRFLLELEPDGAEGRSWYGEPGPGEVLEWADVLRRAGVTAAPHRVSQAYLELAVLVRALQGLSTSSRLASPPDRSSLWAGLFDLRENLLNGAVDDLRALAA
ncbi:MAG: hypothetical protein E6G67_04810 [Actinobacteria bacterium]|nr:MAG: hypothetical protein E6G67_04810 [Actinomycetota bacterium]